MVDPHSVISEEGDFTGAHAKFEAIKNAPKRDRSELLPPCAIFFIGDICVTKEKIFRTLFGSTIDENSTATLEMSCRLYSTSIDMSATHIAEKDKYAKYGWRT